MIRGVSFRIKQYEHEKILSKILQFVDVKKYNWYNVLDQNEVWRNFQGEEILKEKYYSGENFEIIINSEHYILFLKLQAFFERVNYQNLFTYKEFKESECQLMILVSDSDYVEIYAKEIALVNYIYDAAEQNNFSEIEYITEDNDTRMEFNVM